MATCVRCGLGFANVMQMGAHTRKCARTLTDHECNEQEFDGNDAVVGAVTTPATVVADANDVVEEAPVVAVGAITTPVPSLQSLARREIKGWGNETLITSSERPPSTSGTLARDLREVCVQVQNKFRILVCTHALFDVDVVCV